MGNQCAGGGGGGDKIVKMTDKNTVKLLILGISGCGKTTFTKQMKILNMEGFQDFEVDNFRKIILRNISSGLHELILKLSDTKLDGNNEETINLIKQNPTFNLTSENIDLIKSFWNDKAVTKVWNNTKNSMHNAHLDYYLNNIDRIASEDYDPTNEDIVRCRQYTIGASTTVFSFQKYWWKLIDVGGQTPERAKWTAIVSESTIAGLIYFVALDEYDVDSQEEQGKTKLELSLKVWGEVCGSGDFGDGQCNLLFFNKTDVFKESVEDKKKFKAFKKRYPDYEGEQDQEEAQNYIKDKFVEEAQSKGLDTDNNFFPHFTCAIDTEKMQFAWKSVNEWVLKKRLTSGGFEM